MNWFAILFCFWFSEVFPCSPALQPGERFSGRLFERRLMRSFAVDVKHRSLVTSVVDSLLRLLYVFSCFDDLTWSGGVGESQTLFLLLFYLLRIRRPATTTTTTVQCSHKTLIAKEEGEKTLQFFPFPWEFHFEKCLQNCNWLFSRFASCVVTSTVFRKKIVFADKKKWFFIETKLKRKKPQLKF